MGWEAHFKPTDQYNDAPTGKVVFGRVEVTTLLTQAVCCLAKA